MGVVQWIGSNFCTNTWSAYACQKLKCKPGCQRLWSMHISVVWMHTQCHRTSVMAPAGAQALIFKSEL